MKDLISSVINPLPVFFLLVTAGIFFLWTKRIKIGKILLLVAGCWVLVISTRPIPYMLVKSLEEKYTAQTGIHINDTSEKIHILVLAAGHTDDESLPANSQLSGSALGRLTEGVRLHKLFSGSRLVLSGPGGREGLTQADALMRTALIMGVDSNSVLLIRKAKNTEGEAKEYKELFGTNHKLILVTSAIHMPRAIMIFRNKGFNPIPAPTNFIIKHGSNKDPYRWLPAAGYIQMTEAAVHEWAGIGWYSLIKRR